MVIHSMSGCHAFVTYHNGIRSGNDNLKLDGIDARLVLGPLGR